jgi:hypothetical protein
VYNSGSWSFMYAFRRRVSFICLIFPHTVSNECDVLLNHPTNERIRKDIDPFDFESAP